MKTNAISIIATIFIAANASIAQADILNGPVTNTANGHVYFLLSSNTWTGSEAEANGLGGHLATIRDAAENDWVFTNFSTFGGIQRPLWIGLYQTNGSAEPTNGWTWISGEAVLYINWTPGEPNNNAKFGPQNWAMIWPPGASGIVGPYAEAHWNDYWNPDHIIDTGLTNLHWGLYGVVEVIPPAPRLTITSEPPAVRLSWNSQIDRSYQIQYRSELPTNGWANLGSPIAGNGTTNTTTDDVIDIQRFYRVVPFP